MLASSDWTAFNNKVGTSRAVNTTSPLLGGGDLSADRTLSLAGLSSLGTANYVLGANSGATAWEYKNITGTSNEINISHSVGGIEIGIVDPLAANKGGTGTSTTPNLGSLLVGNGSVFTTLATSTDGYALTASYTAPLGVSWSASAGGGISNIVEDTTPQLGGDLDLNGYTVLLNNYPSSNQAGEGLMTNGTVGENVSIGDILYMKSDGKYWKADADASSTMPVAVMAAQAITANNSGKLMHYGYFRNDSWSWPVKGSFLYASTTAGSIASSAPSGSGDQVQVVGYTATSTVIFFNPSPVLIELN